MTLRYYEIWDLSLGERRDFRDSISNISFPQTQSKQPYAERDERGKFHKPMLGTN